MRGRRDGQSRYEVSGISPSSAQQAMKLTNIRIQLNYGGDDITAALVALLQRSSFPYKELDLSRPQEALMMDNLKIKICTLEEVSDTCAGRTLLGTNWNSISWRARPGTSTCSRRKV